MAGRMLQLLAALAMLGAAALCGAESVGVSGRAMGTTWAARYIPARSTPDPNVLTQRIAARLEILENQFSTYRPDSEISRFNASSGTDWFPVSPEVKQMAATAREISVLTDGAFDITVEPLVRLWGFGPAGRRGGLPSAGEIGVAQARVGWQQLEINPAQPALRRTRGGVTVDFSSIAKGFAADALSALLVEMAVPNHLVQVGGDIRTRGGGGAGQGWPAGIETPADDVRPIARVVVLSGQALSTSGDYRNVVIERGRRYGHIIDPRTGAPATSELAAVSVVADSCARSSALATALFVLGPERGFALAEEQRIAGLFFIRRGRGFEQRATSAFAGFPR
jgi:FAD:protein FMN transferase